MLTRIQITAFLGLSLVYWAALLWWRGVPISPELLLPFSGVVGAVSATLLVFDQWLWHWPIFRGWLIKRPYVRGTWKVEIKSDWLDPVTDKECDPIVGYMAVKQTATSIAFTLLTRESRSETVASGIEACKDGSYEFSCSYRNKPKAAYRHRSEVHYGAMLLSADGARPDLLEGDYWTDRKTTGTITLTNRVDQIRTTFSTAHQLFQKPQ